MNLEKERAWRRARFLFWMDLRSAGVSGRNPTTTLTFNECCTWTGGMSR